LNLKAVLAASRESVVILERRGTSRTRAEGFPTRIANEGGMHGSKVPAVAQDIDVAHPIQRRPGQCVFREFKSPLSRGE